MDGPFRKNRSMVVGDGSTQILPRIGTGLDRSGAVQNGVEKSPDGLVEANMPAKDTAAWTRSERAYTRTGSARSPAFVIVFLKPSRY